MEPEISIALRLPGRGSRRLQRDLHAQLRTAILDGRLRAGTRLPTTRSFAGAYGISRNTALAIYDQLSSEGYLFARGKAGTFVAAVSPGAQVHRPVAASANKSDRLNPRWRARTPSIQTRATAVPVLDFRLGVPDQSLFPASTWQRLSARAWRTLSKLPAAYGEPQGRMALREAIASHVSFARAVACGPEDVIVTAGAQQAFDLLARVLVTARRNVVAIENPGYPPLRAAFAAAGATLARVAVDREGLIVERVPEAARVIYVTPSHQFPLGVAMSARRRSALLDFARRHRAVVIEDDYDGEFRFSGRPLDALQTLDRDDSVFYVGTFSKSLFPALRLGYVIAPHWARAALIAAKHAADWHCPVVAQDTLAAFIAEGHLLRHVRKMRRVYASRRARLVAALAGEFAPWFDLLPSIAGLHVAAFSAAALDVPALVQRARLRDVGIHPLREYYGSGRAARDGLVFGYGAIDDTAIAEGLARLRRLLPR
jgi:GntR family transcriptional regulator/MocR family aminotransferase